MADPVRRFVIYAAFLVGAVAAALPVCAGSFGSKDEAEAMVARAAEFLKANGREAAFAAFGDPEGRFADRDLYIVAYALSNGVRLAHPYNARLVGQSVEEAKDIDGKLYGKEIMDVARTKGRGWIDYKFMDPVTRRIGSKSLYVLTVGDIVIGCGIYKR